MTLSFYATAYLPEFLKSDSPVPYPYIDPTFELYPYRQIVLVQERFVTCDHIDFLI